MTSTPTTTTQQTTSRPSPYCHVGTGWQAYSPCVGQCADAGYQERQRHFSDYVLDEDSDQCALVFCADAVVSDNQCLSADGAACVDYGVKFGVAFTAPTQAAAQSRIAPLSKAIVSSVQVGGQIIFRIVVVIQTH